MIITPISFSPFLSLSSTLFSSFVQDEKSKRDPFEGPKQAISDLSSIDKVATFLKAPSLMSGRSHEPARVALNGPGNTSTLKTPGRS